MTLLSDQLGLVGLALIEQVRPSATPGAGQAGCRTERAEQLL